MFRRFFPQTGESIGEHPRHAVSQREKIAELTGEGLMTLKKLLAGALGLALCGLAVAAEWHPQPAASRMAEDFHWLHEAVMVLAIVLIVGVFGFMFWSCYAHRKSVGHQAEQFHENTTIEVVWTLIPALILVLIAWPVTKVVIAQNDTTAPDLAIKVTGVQWKWAYDYLMGEGEGISFVSTLATPRAQIENREAKGKDYLLEVDHELVVPVGKKVRVLATAADVARTAVDEARPFTLAELKGLGETVYAAHCVACHQADGKGMPPAFPPLDGAQIVLGPKGAQIDVLLHGRPQTAMQSFARLNNVELAAVITFTRNNWGNSTAEAVQPAKVRGRRNPP
jgi:heme/copper-type cytochrome/quinol oxidase subunit 2